jgi:hypothetical protein
MLFAFIINNLVLRSQKYHMYEASVNLVKTKQVEMRTLSNIMQRP